MMLRSELEQAICDEINLPERNRTTSRGLGKSALREMWSFLHPWSGRSFSYRNSSKWYQRKKLAYLFGLEDNDSSNPFTKEELEKIYNVLMDRPNKNSWEAMLSWPHNHSTTEA